jgi:hypothetical protein
LLASVVLTLARGCLAATNEDDAPSTAVKSPFPRGLMPNFNPQSRSLSVAHLMGMPTNQLFPSADWPFDPSHFLREDETDDAQFYHSPRFVTHIDDDAIDALTRYYEASLRGWPDVTVLDLCSSWISHLPPRGDGAARRGRVIGLGLSAEELARNVALDERIVRDLNRSPTLPELETASVDYVLCVVSIDDLVRPREARASGAERANDDGSACPTMLETPSPSDRSHLHVSCDGRANDDGCVHPTSSRRRPPPADPLAVLCPSSCIIVARPKYQLSRDQSVPFHL